MHSRLYNKLTGNKTLPTGFIIKQLCLALSGALLLMTIALLLLYHQHQQNYNIKLNHNITTNTNNINNIAADTISPPLEPKNIYPVDIQASQLQQQILELKNTIISPKYTLNTTAFQNFIKPLIKKQLTSNNDWKITQRQIHNLKLQINDLDIQTGNCNNADLLAQLNIKRNELNLRLNNLRQQAQLLRNKTTAQLLQKNWPAYKKYITDIINHKKQKLNTYITAPLIGPYDGPEYSKTLPSPNACFAQNDYFSKRDWLILALFALAGATLALFLHDFITCRYSGHQGHQIPADTTSSPSQSCQNHNPLTNRISISNNTASPRNNHTTTNPPSATQKNTRTPATNEDAITSINLHVNPSEQTTEHNNSYIANQQADNCNTQWIPQYDSLAQAINEMRNHTATPVAILSAFDPHDISPRPAINIAITLTRMSLRVLLIETDITSNHLARVFDIPTEKDQPVPGFLNSYLNQIEPIKTVIPTNLPNLSFMPSGYQNTVTDAANIYTATPVTTITSNTKLNRCLQQLKPNFDIILLYHPQPLTHTLASYSNITLIMTSMKRKISQQLKKLKSQLNNPTSKFIVLTHNH